jgi:hypothetical protein
MSGTTLRGALSAAAAVITLTAVVSGAGLAAASTRSAASGTEHFQLMTTSATSNTSSLIASGAFTDYGVDHAGSKVDTVTLQQGSFQIAHSAGTGSRQFNPTTCLFQLNLKGTYSVGHGTGRYTGISGSGTYQLSILGVGAKSGGTCSKTLPPVAFQQVIRASGPVSLP